MSKLSDAITAKKNSRLFSEPRSLFLTVEESFHPTPLHCGYSIKALFGSKVVLTDEAVSDGG